MPFSASVSVIMLVGPAETELDRLRDIYDAIDKLDPVIDRILLIDDALDERGLAKTIGVGRVKVEAIPNPRRGRGKSLHGGGAVGLMAGLGHLQKSGGFGAVIKIDTDAYLVAPAGQKILDYFAAHSGVGEIGSYKKRPDGGVRDFKVWAGPTADSAAFWLPPGKAVGAGRRKHGLALRGSPARLRKLLLAARVNGYSFGDNIQGGSYAVSAAAMNAMAKLGVFENPLDYLPCNLTEDVLLPVAVRAAGFDLADFNGTGEPFGTVYRGLPCTVDQIVERGYSLIHSLKNDPTITEPEIRAFFKARRGGAIA